MSVFASLQVTAGGVLQVTLAQGSLVQACDLHVHGIECETYLHSPAVHVPVES